MILINTPLPDLFIVKPTVFSDSRGYFLEAYNQDKFHELGVDTVFVQDNESKSSHGVIRGLHYQLAPYSQTKLVRVIEGKILDVAVDIRRNSPTFGKHFSLELDAESKQMLLVPKGFAHGFSVLSDKAIVLYKCDALYNAEAERGILFNDPALNIDWMIDPKKATISTKDKIHPTLENAEFNFTYGK